MKENEDNISPRSVVASSEATATAPASTYSTSNNNNKPAIMDEDDIANVDKGPEGCYLVYEPDSGGRLMIVYSHGYVPMNAVGFWCCGEGKKIQDFKFKQNCGRSELIKGIAGGDSNRRKYFVGWCQFIKHAKAMNGRVIKFANAIQGVEVDVYGYRQADSHPDFLALDEALIDVNSYDAVAVVPRHKEFLMGVKSIVASNFLEMGNIAGASTTML